ncbi:hypothetical protein RLOatenuis_1900 [Rickettsiales bacterium]|nr:hypothetical protein RLOatenuis_1900 [Rickettsiales bacterium]
MLYFGLAIAPSIAFLVALFIAELLLIALELDGAYRVRETQIHTNLKELKTLKNPLDAGEEVGKLLHSRAEETEYTVLDADDNPFKRVEREETEVVEKLDADDNPFIERNYKKYFINIPAAKTDDNAAAEKDPSRDLDGTQAEHGADTANLSSIGAPQK